MSSESEWVQRGVGPVRSDVAWCDSDAIRVRVREGPAVSEWRCRGSRRDGRGRAPTGEAVQRGVSLGDSGAIRVRFRAWEPGRIGVAEPWVPAGRGDPCTAGGKEVAASVGPCRRGDVWKWSKFGAE